MYQNFEVKLCKTMSIIVKLAVSSLSVDRFLVKDGALANSTPEPAKCHELIYAKGSIGRTRFDCSNVWLAILLLLWNRLFLEAWGFVKRQSNKRLPDQHFRLGGPGRLPRWSPQKRRVTCDEGGTLSSKTRPGSPWGQCQDASCPTPPSMVGLRLHCVLFASKPWLTWRVIRSERMAHCISWKRSLC